MPITNLKAQCTATAKSTELRCKNPSAYGCTTCRMHGARRYIISGHDHHWFKHGERSRDGISKRRQIQRMLDLCEELGFRGGFMSGKKTPGRKTR